MSVIKAFSCLVAAQYTQSVCAAQHFDAPIRSWLHSAPHTSRTCAVVEAWVDAIFDAETVEDLVGVTIRND